MDAGSYSIQPGHRWLERVTRQQDGLHVFCALASIRPFMVPHVHGMSRRAACAYTDAHTTVSVLVALIASAPIPVPLHTLHCDFVVSLACGCRELQHSTRPSAAGARSWSQVPELVLQVGAHKLEPSTRPSSGVRGWQGKGGNTRQVSWAGRGYDRVVSTQL